VTVIHTLKLTNIIICSKV